MVYQLVAPTALAKSCFETLRVKADSSRKSPSIRAHKKAERAFGDEPNALWL